jgi:hypothetical protein
MKKTSLGKSMAMRASALAIGATAYYFLGPESKKHQESAKKWTMEAKRKLIKEIEKGKEMTEAMYGDVVDNIVKPYITGGATAVEVSAFAKALKQDWKHISKASKSEAKKAVTKVKASAKKVVAKKKAKN